MSLPLAWANQVGDPHRLRAYETILGRPDAGDLLSLHGTPRGSQVTQPADTAERANDSRWQALVVRWCAQWRHEQMPEFLPGRAMKKPPPQYWTMARDRLL